jgi:hypothetical protein
MALARLAKLASAKPNKTTGFVTDFGLIPVFLKGNYTGPEHSF